MKNFYFLLSKDALNIENLSIFGNKYWNTPNLDELAEKGTVFMRHYTTAVSTSMAFSSMLTGKYSHEFEKRKRYTYVEPNEKESIFSILQNQGYDCHVLWSNNYMWGALPYVKEFGNEEKVNFHIVDMSQSAGPHRTKSTELRRDDELLEQTYKNIFDELDSIERTEKQFIWLHLPHVLKGRISYGDDIDAFDKIIGFVRKKYGDENIYITADHGNMNMHKNISGYGFHIYEPSSRVPLITPRIDNIKTVDHITSHVDLCSIIFENKITKRDYIYVDTQYYAQPNRKLAVISDRYKYIYNKKKKTEELYDILWDPEERLNLLEIERIDPDRKTLTRITEMYFYPYHDRVPEAYEYLKSKKDEIWRVGTKREELEFRLRNDYNKLKAYIHAKKQIRE